MATILYADDILEEEETRKLFTSLFENKGHTFFTAVNGQETLEILAEQQIDLLYLDIQMPVMSGVQVLKELKQRDYQLPIVICSGLSEKEIETIIEKCEYEYVIGYYHFLDINNVSKDLANTRLI